MYVNNVLTTNLVIPDTVTTINSYAFYNCTSLQSVTIGSGVQTIGEYAFYNCSNLTEIKFNATACNDLASSNDVFSMAGQGGDGITVNFGDGVTRVPNRLFYPSNSSDSPNIKQINWNNVTEIGSYAFAYCDLTSLTIGSGVQTIGSYAFAYCDLTSLTIGSGVQTIGSDAFRHCDFTSVTIGSGVQTIGNYAFYNCTNLTEINFNATNLKDLSLINYVFAYAGQDGKGITVNFGDGVTRVPSYLFCPYYSSSYGASYSPNIKHINWNNVTEIGLSIV